jgi:ribosomal protein RSM22 (predicted rRNA methylase)
VAAAFDRALRDAIAAATAAVPGAELQRAVDALSRRYRDGATGTGGVGRLTDAERLAYAVVRLPATAAALDAVFDAVERHTRVEPQSVTDLGAGPGTVLWPAVSRWPGIRRVTLLDRDPELLRLGVRLWTHPGPRTGLLPSSAGPRPGLFPASTGPPPGLLPGSAGPAPGVGPASARARPGLDVQLRTGDLATGDAPAADVVVLSYAIGELTEPRAVKALERALALTSGALVVVEPGTPAGFARIRAVRDRLRASGAALAAPCPHDGACPMAGTDWCHFAVRLDRSRAHRQAKHAALGWEDEKFAYVVAVRDVALLRARAEARVIRRPRRDTGHVRLALCTPGGLSDAVVTRRAPAYRAARDASWGDAWPDTARATAELDPSIE